MTSNIFAKCLALSMCVAVVIVQSIAAGTDYCSMCQGHIGCNNNGQMSSSCSANAKMVQMSQQIKNLILSTHNNYRNDVATGKLPGFQPASRMAVLQWDNELARLAELNGKRCIYGHDKCRKTAQFPMAGQNIALMPGIDKFPDTTTTLPRLMKMWFDEYKQTNMNVINSFQMAALMKSGHFTQIVKDNSVRLGCAVANYQSNGFNMYLICNYAVSNILNQSIYKAGQAASACKTGADQTYRGLCSANEKY